jgi:hypothetical protein
VTHSTILEPADIFFTRGRGLLSRAIRFFTRRVGEARTKVNHVGIVVTRGTLDEIYIVEALSRVKRHRFADRYVKPWRRDDVAIYRPRNLTADEIATVVSAAERYVGRRYGYVKILAHFLDWLLQGAYLFRRLAQMDDYPICSWVVAHAFGKAGKHFGVAPGAATPDDIWDFCEGEADKYLLVRPLGPV